jgi:flagellar protein FliO/FliZ
MIDNTSSLILMSFLKVIALCITIIVAGILYKKYHLHSVRNKHSFIKVLQNYAIGTKERLVLVQLNETQLLLGVSANQINLLHSEKLATTQKHESVDPDPAFKEMIDKLTEHEKVIG